MLRIKNDITYDCKGYEYINYTQLTYPQKEQVLAWRNREEVRKWMFTKDEISLENHLKFIESLKVRKDAYYWMVFKDEKPVGCYNLTNVNYADRTTESGIFFSGTSLADMKDNWHFEVNTVEFTFMLGIETILGHTNVNNQFVRAMNRSLGFVENESENCDFTNHILTRKRFDEHLAAGLDFKSFVRNFKRK